MCRERGELMTDQHSAEQQPPWPPQSGPPNWAAPGNGPWFGPGVYPPQVPPSVRSRRVRTALIWSAVVLVASVATAAVGYEIGVQHSRNNALAQGSGSRPCPSGKTAPDPSATSPAGRALLARVLPLPAGDTLVSDAPEGVMSLSDYVNALYGNDPIDQQNLAASCFQ